MDNRHPFIVLEGTSGTGKSSVAHLLAQRLEAVLVKTPMPPLDEVRHMVDTGLSTVEARHLFYLAAVVEAASRITSLLAHAPVVCDRYILSTECYHRALGSRVRLDYSALGLVEPDLAVLLVCERAERLRRIDDRGWSFNDRREEELGITDRFEEAYRSHEMLVLDTTRCSPEDTMQAVLLNLSGIHSVDPENVRSADEQSADLG